MSLNEHLKEFMEEGISELNRTLFSNISPRDLPEKKVSLFPSSVIGLDYGVSFSSIDLVGLSDNYINRAPELDWRNNFFSFGLCFNKITVQAESCSSRHLIKIGNWTKKGGKKRSVKVDIDDLLIDCTVDYHINFSEKEFSFKPGVTFDFSTIKVKNPSSPFLKALIVLSKSAIKKVASKNVSDRLSTIFAEKIALAIEAEGETLDRFALAHSRRKSENEKNGVSSETPRALQGLDGIGQLPPPRLWQVPEVDVAACIPSTVEQLVENCRTGDLLLFSGMAESSMRIKKMTQSPFSHAVLIVKEPELMDGRALCWQATASFHDGVLRDMSNENGIQLNYLEDMMHDYWDECDDAIVIQRQLMQGEDRAILAEDSRQKLLNYINEMDGKPYTEDMEGLYVQGMFEVQDVGEVNYFCSGTVAETLMRTGLLSNEFMQHQYTPRDFCSLQKNLPLRDGYHYSKEEFVFFNPELASS